MICICMECVKSSKIKTMMMCIKNKQVGECLVCGKVGIDKEKENAIVDEFANQIRYYYSAFEYIQGEMEYPLAAYFPLTNRKNILEKDNFLLNHAICYDKAQKGMGWVDANTDLNKFELFHLYKTNKPLYQQFSYASHMKLPLKEADSALIEQLKEDIKKYNYYEIEEKYRSEIHSIADILPTASILKNSFYRAREGYNKEDIVVDDFYTSIDIPYIGAEIMSPPPYLASAGRFNRMGCAFLYIANERSTAVAELKPRVGTICSTMEVICNDERLYLDFRKNSIPSIEDNMGNCRNINIISSIVSLFLTPVKCEQEYVVTQFLSDIFRKEGYGGIIYDSVQTEGYNILAFYPSKYEFVKNSEKMIKVNRVQYSLLELPDGRDKYKGFTYEKENIEDKYAR